MKIYKQDFKHKSTLKDVTQKLMQGVLVGMMLFTISVCVLGFVS